MTIIVKASKNISEPSGKMRETIVLESERTGDSRLEISEIFVPKNNRVLFENPVNEISIFHVLSGSGHWESQHFANNHVAFLPENQKASFSAGFATNILKTTVKDFMRYEKADNISSREFKIVNWFDEPVLQSEHDDRKRVYIATKNLLGTSAIKGEVIIYPPNTEAPSHYHVGAEHFQYVLAGSGIAKLDGKEVILEPGDLIYNFEEEIHSFKNSYHQDFTFVEFFVPGDCKTIWTTPEKVCTWLPTNSSLSGASPTRFIPKHIHGQNIEI